MDKLEDMVARLRNILKWVTKNYWQNEGTLKLQIQKDR